MSDLTKRIEKLERKVGGEHSGSLLLIVMSAGENPGPLHGDLDTLADGGFLRGGIRLLVGNADGGIGGLSDQERKYLAEQRTTSV